MNRRLFLTAFEPYDRWEENASWLALVEYTKAVTPALDVTTRLYPVDFAEVRRRLDEDLDAEYDYAIHLGQAPGTARVRLEAVGLNVGGDTREPAESYTPLMAGGPAAFWSQLPLAEWARVLKQAGIPATLSYHAGTYLCNATHYLSHFFAERKGLATKSAFVHLPLTDSQAAREKSEIASLPPEISARALHVIAEQLVKLGTSELV